MGGVMNEKDYWKALLLSDGSVVIETVSSLSGKTLYSYQKTIDGRSSGGEAVSEYRRNYKEDVTENWQREPWKTFSHLWSYKEVQNES